MKRSIVAASRARFTGFKQIVDGALLERRDGVLVVGRDEHHLRRALHALRDLEPAQLRHADVEQRDGRVQLFDRAQRGVAVADFGGDAELGPELGERLAQLAPQQRLVVGDDGGRRRHAAGAGIETAATVPDGAPGSNSNDARPA